MLITNVAAILVTPKGWFLASVPIALYEKTMDQTLRRLYRTVPTNPQGLQEQLEIARRRSGCPYSLKSIQLAQAILEAKDEEGGPIAVFWRSRGREVTEIETGLGPSYQGYAWFIKGIGSYYLKRPNSEFRGDCWRAFNTNAPREMQALSRKDNRLNYEDHFVNGGAPTLTMEKNLRKWAEKRIKYLDSGI